tara:strand:+ start:732 stop:977 length:246 start_codon:yes stop_codon:yes gene_type:complete
MGKGSGRRKQDITDEELEKAWDAIFAGHPSDEQFDRVRGKTVLTKPTVDEDDYGNEIPYKVEPEKPKKNDPDRFFDDTGDA